MTDTLFFDRAIFAVRTFVDGDFLDISRIRFPLFYSYCLQFFALGAGVFIFSRVIGHIFSAANVIFILSFLFLLMVRWFYKQGKLLTSIHIVVVFLTITISFGWKPSIRLGFLSISCLSYNKRSNWLTITSLGFYVRMKDCQSSPYCSVRFEQVEPWSSRHPID